MEDYELTGRHAGRSAQPALPEVVETATAVAAAVHYGVEIDGAVRLGGAPRDVAPLLNASEGQVAKWCREGLLRHRKLGRNVWVPASALAEFAAPTTTTTTRAP